MNLSKLRAWPQGILAYFHRGVGEAMLCIMLLMMLFAGLLMIWLVDFSGYQETHGPSLVVKVSEVNAPLPNPTKALYEPDTGCILGAYIDLDPGLKQVYRDETQKFRRLPEEFEGIVGKPHGMYFFYLGYGQPLPKDWVKKLSDAGKYVHIALEPNDGLDAVQKDEYLFQLTRDLRQSKAKIFLRFASEMNGPWVNYHGDPPKYRAKFQMVASMMHKYAKNVAMVWCPLFTPVKPIPDYYPGDEAVDWVGVNIYNVTYFNQNAKQPGWDVTPQKMLQPIYNTYARTKPIMIAEYGVTHFSAMEQNRTVNFAVDNITSFYESLKSTFPRVKCINYFNCNNMQLAHRMNNDYRVTNDPNVLKAYQDITASSYFLPSVDAVDASGFSDPSASIWTGTKRLTSNLNVIADPQFAPKVVRVEFRVDGQVIHVGIGQDNWSCDLSPQRIAAGQHKLTVTGLDDSGHEILSEERTFVVEK